MSMYDDIKLMHHRFGISNCAKLEHPQTLGEAEYQFRIKCLEEELQEFKDAVDLTEQIDALLDLVVFAMGTAERMGVDWESHWDEVLLANLRKELCNNASESKRDFEIDLKKPIGWKAPNHQRILKRYK